MDTELEELEQKRKEALEILEEWNKNKCFEVGDKQFTYANFSLDEKQKILAYYSKIEHSIMIGVHSYLTDKEFKETLKIIENKVLFDDIQISKDINFWEKNEEYLLDFFSTACKTICFRLAGFTKKKVL